MYVNEAVFLIAERQCKNYSMACVEASLVVVASSADLTRGHVVPTCFSLMEDGSVMLNQLVCNRPY